MSSQMASATKTAASAPPVSAPVRRGLLQRQCACGPVPSVAQSGLRSFVVNLVGPASERMQRAFGQVAIFPQVAAHGRGFLMKGETPSPDIAQERQIGIGQDGIESAPEAVPDVEPVQEAQATETSAAEAPEAEALAPVACTITHRTAVHAPDGTPDTRKIIGVCETVHFTVGGQAADWTANNGWPRARTGRTRFNWAAPERSGTSRITATIPATGQTCTLDMTVVAPSRIRMRRRSVLGWYAAGTAGAGMTAVVRVYPRNVNFGWVAMREDPGPASNVTGYFAALQAGGANLNHVPNPNFMRLGWNNTICCDTAATVPGTLPPPWLAGTWDWRIPTRYRCVNSTGTGRVFTRTLQQFRINATGRVTVRKQGAVVSRSP